MKYVSLLFFVLFVIDCGTSAQTVNMDVREMASRAVFKRSSAVLRAPTEYAKRYKENGTEYDPRPRIVAVDEKNGKFELRWIGYDGKEKVVAYQRYDAVNGLVEARAETNPSGNIYKYLIRNFKDSPTYVASFVVQTFSSDVKKEKIIAGEDLHIGHMAQHIPHFSDGLWRTFAPVIEKDFIIPGVNREFSIPSIAPPGIVKCFVQAGSPSIKGVGEHMPSELEAAMPGYEEMASCVTIGPVEKLSTLSKPEKATYFIENLPKFVEAGWMGADSVPVYEKLLSAGNLSTALSQAKYDLEKGYITTEVLNILEGLNR